MSTHSVSQKQLKGEIPPQDPSQVKPHAVTISGQQSPSLMQNSSQEQVDASPPQAFSSRHRVCAHAAEHSQAGRKAAVHVEQAHLPCPEEMAEVVAVAAAAATAEAGSRC